MKPKVLVTFVPPEAVIARARELFDAKIPDHTLTTEEMQAHLANEKFDALMVIHAQKFSADVVEKLPAQIKVVATFSVGFDHLDIAAGKARGLIFTNTPDVLTDCTADTALLLMLAALRRARPNLHVMESGWGTKSGMAEGLGLRPHGKTVGILGMGRIGQAFADRARAFGMKIAYHNRSRLEARKEKGARYFSHFEEMLPHCNVLSLHAPASGETKAIMNARTFSLLAKNAVFVNTARGSLVDEAALMAALNSKHLFGAGLDVFQTEPNYNQRFKNFENVFLLPHIGSATVETRNEMGFRALANIAAVLSGSTAPDPIT